MDAKQSQEGRPEAITGNGGRLRLLLHCCCAPCASSVIERLVPYYSITMYFYNPNIAPPGEYRKRADEMHKLAAPFRQSGSVDVIICDYEPAVFAGIAAQYADEPEGGTRCRECFALRLEETAKQAEDSRYDCFATTLSVSPYKNAEAINETGVAFAAKYSVDYLRSDFKKSDGYRRSVELSKELGLYRQGYCGCKPEK